MLKSTKSIPLSTDVSFQTNMAPRPQDALLDCKQHFPKHEFFQVKKPRIAEMEETTLSSVNSKEKTDNNKTSI